MTEAKHTPGPWYPGHLGSDSKCQCANVCSESYAGGICQITVGNGKPISDGGNDGPPREEAIANMHLISAAPDMYKALDALTYKVSEEGIERARRALAKAEGRQSP